MRSMIYPPPLQLGDKVAIIAPSGGWLPHLFPHVFDLGLRRLHDDFGLVPVEYPTTRAETSSMPDRARDVHAAFTDLDIKGIICAIGGEDQIKLLSHVDANLLRQHPKRFFGYSDATNLELLLWNQGIVSFYGAAIMVQFAMPSGMHDYTREWVQRALFVSGDHEVLPAPSFSDVTNDWGDLTGWQQPLPLFPNSGWHWANADRVVEGITWGGCLEIIDFQLRAGRYLLPNEAYTGAILLLETSEEQPDADYVYRVLMGMGERGMLAQFAAVLVGRPKAWGLTHQRTPEQKVAYSDAQREAIQRALDEYHPGVMAVYNLDFGHTDPQWIVPLGGMVRVDGMQHRIFARY